MCCIGNVNRGLRLLRARSGIPRLLEGELLKPWPQQRPPWFTAWIVNQSRLLEEAIRQPAVIYQVRPREPSADAGVQTRQHRLQPPRRNQAVEAIAESDHTANQTSRVPTRTISTQTSTRLVRNPDYLLGLLTARNVVPMTRADELVATFEMDGDLGDVGVTSSEIGRRVHILPMEFPGWDE
jgi:hypothetical protein